MSIRRLALCFVIACGSPSGAQPDGNNPDGTTWSRVSVPTLDYPYAISGTSGSNIWIAEYGGATHHYDGATWTKYQTPGTAYLYAIYGTATDAWVAGGSNSLYHFNGASWQ